MSIFRRHLQKLSEEERKIIHFEDVRAKEFCVRHFDADGNGKLSYEEAASVTDDAFFNAQSNDAGLVGSIQYFDELRFFTALTKLSKNFPNVKRITLPESLSNVSHALFFYVSNMERFTIEGYIEKFSYTTPGIYMNLKEMRFGKNGRVPDEQLFSLFANKFSVSEENPYYSVMNEHLMSKDGKTLLKAKNNGVGTFSLPADIDYSFNAVNVIGYDTLEMTAPPKQVIDGNDSYKKIMLREGSECCMFQFVDCNALRIIVIRFTDASKIFNNTFMYRNNANRSNVESVFVPDANIDDFKARMTDYAAVIKPLSNYSE